MWFVLGEAAEERYMGIRGDTLLQHVLVYR